MCPLSVSTLYTFNSNEQVGVKKLGQEQNKEDVGAENGDTKKAEISWFIAIFSCHLLSVFKSFPVKKLLFNLSLIQG